MLKIFKRRIWVPNVIYLGLPWMCFLTTFISYVIPGVPPFLLIVTTLLGFYALIVLAIRFAEAKVYN